MIHTAIWLLIIALSVYLLVWLISYYYLANKLMFYPPQYDEQLDGQFDFVALEHPNGQIIQGLWIGEGQPGDWIVLYQHGNAELLVDIVPRLMDLHESLGLPIFAYEYRGYGGSDGQHSIKHMREDGELAWRYLMDKGYQASQVIVYGRSLGTSNATYLSKKHNPVGAMLLEVPMWDAFRIYADHFWTWRGHLENGRRIKHITAPTLILYARNDELINTWHSAKLYQASAAQIKERIGFDVLHGDVPQAPGYKQTLKRLLAKLNVYQTDLNDSP